MSYITDFRIDADKPPSVHARKEGPGKAAEYRRKLEAGSKLLLFVQIVKRKSDYQGTIQFSVPLTPAEQLGHEKALACQRQCSRNRRTRERVAKGRGN